MNENWHLEKRNNFGWYLESQNEVKAIWMPVIMFESAKSSRIDKISRELLIKKLLEYSSDIIPEQNLLSAIYSYEIIVSNVSENLGGGFMIALPLDSGEFQTIANKRSPQTLSDTGSFNKYKGVKGWLALFCLSLIIIGPLLFLIGIPITINMIKENPKLADFKVISYIKIVIGLILTILSIRTGIYLLNIKPNAVKIAKQYLTISLIFSFVTIFLDNAVKLPYDLEKSKMISTAVSIVMSFISFGIWYSYLNVSKRVIATYPKSEYE